MKIENKNEFINADKVLNLQQISADEIAILVVDEIYDGPLNGSCEWNGIKYYFYSFDQLHDDKTGAEFPSKYLLIDLNDSQSSVLERTRELFSRWTDNILTTAKYTEFLNTLPPQKIDIKQLVGWFDSSLKRNDKPTQFVASYFEWRARQKGEKRKDIV
jgi:hypothetical protein